MREIRERGDRGDGEDGGEAVLSKITIQAKTNSENICKVSL
jgi:hypothetical protein